jgi:peptide/nickel transport system ATP-binding protein
MRGIRGRVAIMIFQEPMMSLNPVLRASTQIEETLRHVT